MHVPTQREIDKKRKIEDCIIDQGMLDYTLSNMKISFGDLAITSIILITKRSIMTI